VLKFSDPTANPQGSPQQQSAFPSPRIVPAPLSRATTWTGPSTSAEGESVLTRLQAAFGVSRGLASPGVETPGSAGVGVEYFDGREEGRRIW
jgi:hypothetical protein